MTNKEKKAILSSYRGLRNQQKAIQAEYDAISLVKSPRLDGMPRGSGQADLSMRVAEIERLEKLFQRLSAKKFAALKTITDAIEAMADKDERTLLYLHYIEGLSFDRTAEEMEFSRRHVLRIHGRALAHFMEGEN